MSIYAFCVTEKLEIDWIDDEEIKKKIRWYFSKIVKRKSIEIFESAENVYVIAYIEKLNTISLMKKFGELVRFVDGKFEETPKIVIDNLDVDKDFIYEIVQLSRYKYFSNKREIIPLKIILKNGSPYRNKEIDNIVECVYRARDIVNLSLAEKSPLRVVEEVKKDIQGLSNINIKIIRGKELIKEKLNLVYEVGKGSDNEPCVLILEYLPLKKNEVDFAIVGKGVVFDAGGYNIKLKMMEEMRFDLSGGVAALYSLIGLARKEIKKNVICAVPLVENLVSGGSYKPGDVLFAYNGKSVEIANTDAEGRLILADVIAYVQEKYRIRCLIDIASLTLACMIALGRDIAGIMGNDKELIKKFMEVGERIGENVWEFPLIEEYFANMLESKIADIRSLPYDPWAGSIIGGMFLKFFVNKNIRWVHLDIAGPCYTTKPKFIYSAGATGFGVRLLTKVIEEER